MTEFKWFEFAGMSINLIRPYLKMYDEASIGDILNDKRYIEWMEAQREDQAS